MNLIIRIFLFISVGFDINLASEELDANSDGTPYHLERKGSHQILREHIDILPKPTNPIDPALIQTIGDSLNKIECITLINLLMTHPSARYGPKSDWARLRKYNYFCATPLKVWNSKVMGLYTRNLDEHQKEEFANSVLIIGLDNIERKDLGDLLRDHYKNGFKERIKEHRRKSGSTESSIEDRLRPMNPNLRKKKVREKVNETTTVFQPGDVKRSYLINFLIGVSLILLILGLGLIWCILPRYLGRKLKDIKKMREPNVESENEERRK